MSRLLVAALAFAIGAATLHLFGCNKIRDSIFPRAIHSSENNSPYAVLEGRTVRLKPFNATFDIPESWLTQTSEKNLYLTWQELNEADRNNGGDEEDAEVINSVLSFKDCAAHVGSKGWGNHLWNDLQARVYVVELKPEAIDEKVREAGLSTATNVFERASLLSGNHGEWQKRTLDVLDAPSDFILIKRIDFYHRPFANKTVVFVFMHPGGFEETHPGGFGETISQILDSFRWSNGS